jgi:hypothetical protein
VSFNDQNGGTRRFLGIFGKNRKSVKLATLPLVISKFPAKKGWENLGYPG